MCNKVAKKLAAVVSNMETILINSEHEMIVDSFYKGPTVEAIPIPVKIVDEALEEMQILDTALNEALVFIAEELKMPETAEALRKNR